MTDSATINTIDHDEILAAALAVECDLDDFIVDEVEPLPPVPEFKGFVHDKPRDVCPRCGGLGKMTAYMHRNGGICYKCGGTGKA